MIEYLFSFKGRSGRLSYFMFFLFWIVLFILFGLMTFFLGMLSPALFGIGMAVLTIALMLSSLAITVRRLHDMDLSGWIYPIVVIVPYILMLAWGILYGYMDYHLEGLSNDVLFDHPIEVTGLVIYLNGLIFHLMLMAWPGVDEGNRFEA